MKRFLTSTYTKSNTFTTQKSREDHQSNRSIQNGPVIASLIMHQGTIRDKLKCADYKIEISYFLNSNLFEDDCISKLVAYFF